MAIVRWLNTTSLWNTPSAWSTGTVPGADDIAVVLGTPYIDVGNGVNAVSDNVGSLSIDASGGGPGYMELAIEKHANLTIDNSLSLAGNVSITVNPSATLTVSPGATFDNNDNGVLTGMDLYVGFHSTVSLPGAPIQTLDDCSIELDGRLSEVQSSAGAGYTKIEQSLTKISKGSTLDIRDRNYTTSNAIENDGTLQVSGIFTSGLITSTGTIFLDGGTIASSLVSTGYVDIGRKNNTFSGAADVFYETSLAGWMVFSGGTVSLPNLTYLRGGCSVAGADVTLGKDSKIQNFTLSSGSLTLGDGAAVNLYLYAPKISGGSVSGAGEIKFAGGTELSDVTLGGGIAYDNFGAVTQNGGDIVLGDSTGAAVTFNNRRSSNFLITDDSGIALGLSQVSVFINEGLFEKTGSGEGESVIAPQMVDNGTIVAAIGTLDFTNDVFGKGALRVDVGADLEFDAFVVPYLTLSFSGPESGLVLDDAHDFHALINDFTTNQTIDLAGFNVADDKFRYTPASGGADGYLLIVSGTQMANLHFEGQYQTSDFHVASDNNGGTLLTFSHN